MQLPDGAVIDDFYTVTIPDAAMVAAITTNGEILLKKEYRYACGMEVIECPAGMFNPDEKDPLAVAKRELLEETGLTANSMALFGVFSGPETHYVYPNGDEVSNVDVVFLCRNWTGTIRPQEEEVSEIRFFSAADMPPCEQWSPPIRPALRQWRDGKLNG